MHICSVTSTFCEYTASSDCVALIYLALLAAAWKTIAVAQNASPDTETVHVPIPLDSCHTGRATIWISAAISTGLKPFLHSCSAFTWTEHCQGLRTGNGTLPSSGICMACSTRLLSLLPACSFLKPVSPHHELDCCMSLSGKVISSICRHVHISNCT